MLTLMEDVEQGTPEWHDQRRGMVTASVVGQLLTPTLKVADNDKARGLLALLVAERITGWTEETFMSADMWRGVESEPIARDLYSEHRAPATELGFMVRDDWGFNLGYSPDGLVGSDGLIEIKAPRPKTHLQTILADEIPAQHVAQCQAGLLVSGRKWIDFVSYCGGMPMFIKRMHPDPQWHAAIVAACTAFEQTAQEMQAEYATATTDLPATKRLNLELVI